MSDVLLNYKKIRYCNTKTLTLFLKKSDFFYFRYFVACNFFFLLNFKFECKHVIKYYFSSNLGFNFYNIQ